MTEIAEKAGTSGQNPDVKREPVPTNWEEREAASATTTGAPAAAAAEIGAKRARNEAEESGEEEAPTRTKVLIRGAEAETETPKKTDEKSGDTRQLQPGQGWTIEAARRRIFAALKKITEATNREMTEKLTFRRDDQRQVREAQDEIQEAVSDMLMEVVLAREERVLQVRLQRMEAPAGRDMRGPSQKKLDQLREDLAKEAGVEPPARKGAQPPTEQWETVGKKGAEKPQGGQTKGAARGAQPRGRGPRRHRPRGQSARWGLPGGNDWLHGGQPLEEFRKSFGFLTKRKCQNERRQNMVFAVEPKIHHGAMERGKVVVGLTLCFVTEEIRVKQCFRCHRFGHIARECKSKELCFKCFKRATGRASARRRPRGARTASGPGGGKRTTARRTGSAQNSRG
jgi:hypothetical protein